MTLIELPSPIIKFFKQLNIFKRNKKPFEAKVFSLMLFITFGSVRKVSKLVSKNLVSISKSSVHDYFRSFGKKELIKELKPKHHSIVAIDETVVKINGKRWYVWLAIDTETKELITFHISRGRNWLEALIFLKKLKRMCLGKLPLVLVDKGPWYRDALQRLGFKFEHETFGKRNVVERFFGYLKQRSKVFYNNINCKHEHETLYRFVNTFVFWYVAWR